MAARRRSRAATTPLVTVCRGCCCGTVGKHPAVDDIARLCSLPASALSIDSRSAVDGCDCDDEGDEALRFRPNMAGRAPIR